ncbi:MAG: hypothetical protein ACYS80_17610 [Planctomycetota bacterium]
MLRRSPQHDTGVGLLGFQPSRPSYSAFLNALVSSQKLWVVCLFGLGTGSCVYRFMSWQQNGP